MTEHQFDLLMQRLIEIRNILAFMADPPEHQEELPCVHPMDRRVDLSTLQEEHWKCRDCGFIYQQHRH